MTTDQFKFEKKFTKFAIEQMEVKKSDLGLRYDRVVLFLTKRLKTFTEQNLDANKIALVTLTAPILVPNDTCEQIEEKILKGSTKEKSFTINGNSVRVKIVTKKNTIYSQCLLLVHNPTVDAKWLLGLATEWIN